MDGMDLMWDVVQPEDSFNAKSFDFINPVNDEIASLFNEKRDLSNGAQLYEKNWIVKIYHHTMDTPINVNRCFRQNCAIVCYNLCNRCTFVVAGY